jgi:amidophosphoribosyltransferase
MSDQIKHECGIALVRLLKPLEYYSDKYGTAFWGLNKLVLLMQKQYNRGQDGVGLATVKLDMPPGTRYVSRKRALPPDPVKSLFDDIQRRIAGFPPERLKDPKWIKENMPYAGEVLLGHLRYGTFGGQSLEYCHPFHRQNNWITRNLLLAGNFNMTNVDELFGHLIELGQHPKEMADTVTVLEKIGHFLDMEVEMLFRFFKAEGLSNAEITPKIAEHLDVRRILERSARKFDGGYVMAGIIGHGDAFVMRDPNGIRPAFWYRDDEVVVAASERPAIMTCFNVNYRHIQELKPAHALIVKRNGDVAEEQFLPYAERRSCSFERIYFSRGNDREIYQERIRLGEKLAERVAEAVRYDFGNTVYSFIPNTAEAAYYGLVRGTDAIIERIKREKTLELCRDGQSPSPEQLEKIHGLNARYEKLIHKDVKLRTFIAEDASREELVSQVYDVTYGIVQDHVDTLVLMDDSIVRGTTLQQSILRSVARLKPKKVIVVSSAPQIRYPDCYGIDMSKMKDFSAFQALVALLDETGRGTMMQEVYERCKTAGVLPKEAQKNEVKVLYDLFSPEDIARKMAELIRPKDFEPELEFIFQTIEGLHEAIPNHKGDWYFSGDYPTPGGNAVVNRAFVYFVEGINKRGY